LYHIPSDAASTPSYASGNDYSNPASVGFGHIGFTVPDVATALKRVEEFGYEVIKPLGKAEESTMGVSTEIVEGKEGGVAEGYKHVFQQLAFIRDPDVSTYFLRAGVVNYR
jgi:lactoylglutathione lyase